MPRHPAIAHLDAGAYSGCPLGTRLAVFQNGKQLAFIPSGVEVFLVDPVSGKLLRRITGGDDLNSILAPIY